MPDTSDELTRKAQQTWEAVAPAWEHHRGRVFAATRAVSERLVEAVDPRPGDTILEITAGTGETGFLAAERIGPEGHLVSTDFSANMVRAAERGARARGLTNVECRVMDAQALDLGDACVDGVVSRFGLMLVPDAKRALAEAHRVLCPGGRLAYAVWGAIDRNPWITLLVGALLQTGQVPGGDPFGPGGLFSLADPERNAQLTADTAFSDVHIEEISGAMEAENLDDYWSYQTSISGPVATLFASLAPDEQHAVRAAFSAAAEPFREGTGYRLPFYAILVRAIR